MPILKKKVVNRSVYDLALERVRAAFDRFDTITVSFSGGKDSTVCLNLAREVARERGRLPLRVFFFDEEAIPFQTEAYARRVSQLPDVAFEWYCLPVQHRNACSRRHPYWSPWDPADRDKWVRPLPLEAITELPGLPVAANPADRLTIPQTTGLLHDPGRYGTCGMLMGIRGQESLIRQRAVSRRSVDNYLIPWDEGTSRKNLWKVYPIYDWQTSDVWTAPKLFGWDYNHAYDVMDQAGIPHHQQRCSPAYGEEPLRGFSLYKTCFPDIWDKMSQRVPGANTALLYARTDLYGWGSTPEKPAEVSWQDWVLHYVAQFGERERPIVAANIQRCLDEQMPAMIDMLAEGAASKAAPVEVFPELGTFTLQGQAAQAQLTLDEQRRLTLSLTEDGQTRRISFRLPPPRLAEQVSITLQLDGKALAESVGKRLADEIRLKTGAARP